MNFLKAALIGAISLGAVNAAQAADMAETYAPTVNSQTFDWSGFYLGIVGGYGFGEAYNAAGILAAGTGSFNSVSGVTGGLTGGANMQVDQFVLGLETDFQFSGMNQTVATGFGATTATVNLDYYGTLRARVGYAFDQVLPYVTGGLAYGQGTISSTVPGAVTNSQTHVGFTVGAGLEVAMTDNLTVKGEYLYTDLGTQTYMVPAATTGGLRFHTIRAGVNFLF